MSEVVHAHMHLLLAAHEATPNMLLHFMVDIKQLGDMEAQATVGVL